MTFSAWIASVLALLRARRRHAPVVVGALLAIFVAAWWAGLLGGAATHPRIEPSGAPARTHAGQTPFTALLWPQSPALTAKDDELCGYGPVPLINDIPQIPPEVQSAALLALADLAGGLATGPTERERALGLYLQSVYAAYAAGAAWVDVNGACDRYDLPCNPALAEAMRSAEAESRSALVRLATTSSDADAYSLALLWCGAEPDCGLLNAAQWARIEPDNATPWLHLAAEAQRRSDRAGLEAALSRASKARFSNSHSDQISELLASEALAAQSPPVQIEISILLLGIQAAWSHPYYQALTQYCSASAQADPNRVQTCGDLAAILINQGRSEVDVMFGAKILEQIGSSDPRLSAVLDQADAVRWQWSQVLKSIQLREHRLLSCDSLQALRRNAAARVRLGESGRLRQELAATGVTTSQAAQQWRAERQRLLQLSQAQKPAQ
jgi:hypothetical protein